MFMYVFGMSKTSFCWNQKVYYINIKTENHLTLNRVESICELYDPELMI